MAIIFSSRELVDSFKTRNVVFESSAVIARNGDLILRSILEFGAEGCIRRQTFIKTDSLHTFSISTHMGEYQAHILEIIDALELAREWLRGNKQQTFSQFVDQESPLYFHGRMDGNDIVFSMFGPTLNGLALKCKNNTRLESLPFSDRLETLADLYRNHLKAVDGISIKDVINGQLYKDVVAC